MRNTNTRDVLEAMIEDSLGKGGYDFQKKMTIDRRLGGGKFSADYIAYKDECTIVITAKWQETSGSAENKIPYDYMCLADVIQKNDDLTKGYLVLGGDGWSKDDFFINELKFWINIEADVKVMKLSKFVVSSNLGRL